VPVFFLRPTAQLPYNGRTLTHHTARWIRKSAILRM